MITSQQTQTICITFVQCWANVEDVGPTLYKCYTDVLCLLGCHGESLCGYYHIWLLTAISLDTAIDSNNEHRSWKVQLSLQRYPKWLSDGRILKMLLQFIHLFMHLFIHSFIYSFIHSFIHSSIHPTIHSLIHSFIHALMLSFLPLFIHSFIRSFVRSLMHSFVHSSIHLFMHSLS